MRCGTIAELRRSRSGGAQLPSPDPLTAFWRGPKTDAGQSKKRAGVGRVSGEAMFRSPESVLRAKSIAIVGRIGTGALGPPHLSQPARLRLSGPADPGQSTAEGSVRRALRAVAARRAGAGRACDGHRARHRRRRRARGRGSRRRQHRHDLFGGDGRRPRSGVAQARRLAEGFPRPQQDQGGGPELHGRLQLSREDLRLSEQRAAALPGRLGERGVPVGRHAAVLAAHVGRPRACASPTASPPATRSASISPTI